MSRTLAFQLSVLAGVILWAAQLDAPVSWIFADLEFVGIPARTAASIGFVTLTTVLIATLIHVLETRFERSPYRKYRELREDLHLVLSHWRDDFLSSTRKTKNVHRIAVENLLRSLARTLDKSLPGAVFQVSIMVPSGTHPDELEIGFGCQSDAGDMIPFVTNRRFRKGEGYCGTAWYELAPQSGNGRRRWVVLRDPRYSIERPEGHRDENKSYFTVPIPAPKNQAEDILGILSIDSTNHRHFLRGRKNAVFLKRLLTPVMGLLQYHLERL